MTAAGGMNTASFKRGNDVVVLVLLVPKSHIHGPAVRIIGAAEALEEPEAVPGGHVVNGETIDFHVCTLP